MIGTVCVASNSDSNGAQIAETPLARSHRMTESTTGADMDHLEDWLITIICTALTIGITWTLIIPETREYLRERRKRKKSRRG